TRAPTWAGQIGLRTAVPLAASTWRLDQRRRANPTCTVRPWRSNGGYGSAAVLPQPNTAAVSGWRWNRTPRTPWLSAAPRTAIGVHKAGVWTVGVGRLCPDG